ncbi:3',5'-cyclic-AMP phosphodiesterase [Tumidithrix helvetica PCC 7403]|uniref:3',5'-cyclic-AMP phosphodiesterase n=1 Tax=Tumidithrix helvetica TaxID=3457545 RepID=UPI003C820DC3
MLLVAQLTDIHLFADRDAALWGIKTEDSFQSVLVEVANLNPQPDLLILTGDLTQDGDKAAYLRLRDALQSLNIDTYCLAGNHDDLDLMPSILQGDRIFAANSSTNPNSRIQRGNWQFLFLNSVLIGEVDGLLSDQSLAWLEEQLQSHAEMPTLIAFHHPALPVGCDWMDSIALRNQQEFWQVCDRFPQIQVAINGHAHQAFDLLHKTAHNQIRYYVTPSTCIQFKPNTPKFQIDPRSPGFRLLSLFPDGNVETTVHRLAKSRFQPDLTVKGY